MSKISISIIGTGKISVENELDNFRKKPASHLGTYLKYKKIFNVKGIYDINQNKCKKYSKLFNIKYFKSLNELLNSRSDISLINSLML